MVLQRIRNKSRADVVQRHYSQVPPRPDCLCSTGQGSRIPMAGLILCWLKSPFVTGTNRRDKYFVYSVCLLTGCEFPVWRTVVLCTELKNVWIAGRKSHNSHTGVPTRWPHSDFRISLRAEMTPKSPGRSRFPEYQHFHGRASGTCIMAWSKG